MTIADFERAREVMSWGLEHPTLAVLPEMGNEPGIEGGGTVSTYVVRFLPKLAESQISKRAQQQGPE